MNTTEISIKMILDRWNQSIAQADKLIDALSDAQLERDVAPGKNRGIYLLGHLIAVHDDMLVLMGMGTKRYPELNAPFIDSPDKAHKDLPGMADLRATWKNQCEEIRAKFSATTAEQWYAKHNAVSAEDFAKEPHRNKLNVVLTRTTHLQYHLGQLVLLK